jgi:hypothetical protein
MLPAVRFGSRRLVVAMAFAELLTYFTALLYVSSSASFGWLFQVLAVAAIISLVLLPFTVGIACWKSPGWAVRFLCLGIIILAFSFAILLMTTQIWARVGVQNPQVVFQRLPAINTMTNLYHWSPLAALMLIIPSGIMCLKHAARLLWLRMVLDPPEPK